MKKLLILTNAVWISIICFQACKQVKPIVGSDSLPSVINKFCPGCADYSKNNSNTNANAYGNTKGLKRITATTMAANYTANCQNLLSERLGGEQPDARSVWFSLETLKEFVFNIEKSLCNQNCNQKLELGVRIYYAQYPDIAALRTTYTSIQNGLSLYDDLQDINNRYGKNHTLFMVPTYDKAIPVGKKLPIQYDTVHVDFDPWHLDNCNSPKAISAIAPDERVLILSPDQKQFGKGILKNNGKKNALTNNSLLQNHGNLYPPDNPQGSAF